MAEMSSAQYKKHVLKWLNGNDPDATGIPLAFDMMSSLDLLQICEAMERHPFVKTIVCTWSGRIGYNFLDYTPFLNLLKQSDMIWGVSLVYSPVEVTYKILEALAENTKLRSLQLGEGTWVPVDSLSYFLQASSSITSLGLDLYHLDESRDYPVTDLTKSIAENETLEELTLRSLHQEFNLVQVLRGAAEHKKLQKVKIIEEDHYLLSPVANNAIRYYCQEKSSTIKRIEFVFLEDSEEET